MSKELIKLKENASKENYRAAERIINSGSILFCRETIDSNLEFTIRDQDKNLITVKFDNINECLKKMNGKYNVFELASFIHYFKNKKIVKYVENKQPTKTVDAIVLNDQTELLSAELKIALKNKDLHASSTWESCKISVTIFYKNKIYIGNSSKLRHLRFDETKTANSYTLDNFNYQDRQIIRFLTQYAEADGTDFSLKADEMAEFLHCFNENKPIYINETPLIIHSHSATLIGLHNKEENKIYPGILVNSKILPLICCNFVTGRSGAWVGYFGEYWWIPAVADILWIRKFLLSDGLGAANYIKTQKISFPVLDFPKHDIQFLPCIPIYYINLSLENEIILSLKFKYLDREMSISSQRLSYGDNGFWKRDTIMENSVVNEIKRLGFIPEKNHTGHFSIKDAEQKGLFLYDVLNQWLIEKKHIFFSPEIAKLVYNLKPLKFHCTSLKELDAYYIFKYNLCTENDDNISWNYLTKTVKSNRNYVELDNKMIAKIPTELRKLVLSFQGIVSIVKEKNDYLKLPKAALLYWLKIGKNAIVSIPKEWEKKKKYIQAETEFSKVKLEKFKGDLKSYQLEAVGWLKNMLLLGFNPVLADEMGLGKTIEALALINELKQHRDISGPCLVVCPTSLTENWRNEAGVFTPTLRTKVISGISRQEAINNINNYDLVITSYSLVKRDIEYYEKIKFSLLILDEAQHIKNSSTINARVCKAINTEHKIVLTGTPLENSPEDVWSIFDFLNPGMLGTKESFKRLYSKIENDHVKQEELAERIAPFILRRHKNEVEQLPKKTEHILYCNLLPAQQKLYDNILRDGINKYHMFANGKKTRFDVLASLTRLRQLCCHPELLPELMREGEMESAKMNLLKELLLESLDSGQKILVFSQFTSLLSIIRTWLKNQNIAYEYLDGSTVDRQRKVDDFNENHEKKIFLLSLKAGGTGLNITSANNVIIYDPWWNPTAELQATDRTHRIGQTLPVTTIKLVAKDTIEEKILELQKRKQGLFNGIIENSTGYKKVSDKDLAFLFNTI